METDWKGSTSPPGPAGKIPVLIVGGTLVLALLMGLAALAPGFFGENSVMKSVLMAFVEPYREIIKANFPTQGEIEYIVFTVGEGTDYEAAFAKEPSIRFLRTGTLPGTIVVSLKVPSRPAVKQLRQMPFAGLVIPNNGLFFCH